VKNKIITLIKEAENLLKSSDIDTFSLDVKILLAHCLSLDQPHDIIFRLNEELSKDLHDKFMLLVKRRSRHEPVAYIVGYKHFWKHTYKVNQTVLIPRPETEAIIEVVLKEMAHRISDKLRILDLGTGSGCIILSLLGEFKNSFGVAVDVSKEALNIAEENAAHYQLRQRVKFVKSNWFENLDLDEKFDIIVSNPPYISQNEWENLEPNVRDFEPHAALTDFADGLKNYMIIAESSKKFLEKDGVLALEIGYNQSDSVQEILRASGYATQFHKDLQGINRIVCVRAPSM
jgi:release factor glutamine methyltransferase